MRVGGVNGASGLKPCKAPPASFGAWPSDVQSPARWWLATHLVSARMKTPTTANNQNPMPCRRRRWPRLAPWSSDSSPRRSDEPCRSQQRRLRFCCHIRLEIPVGHRSSMRKRSPNSPRRRNSPPPILFAKPPLMRRPQPPPSRVELDQRGSSGDGVNTPATVKFAATIGISMGVDILKI